MNRLLCVGHLFAFAIFIALSSVSGSQLGDYITDFSPLFYDSIELHKRHLITKRSIYDKFIHLKLAHDERTLDLSLHPTDDDIFHPDTVISTNGIESKFDKSHLYSGYVKGDPDSSVTGSIIKGVFQGMISTGSGDVFYVDRKEYHPSHPLTTHDQIHSVIYKQDDVDIERFNEDRRVKRGVGSDGFCGLRFSSVADWMKRMEGDRVATVTHAQLQRGRNRRQTTPSRNVCNMFLQSDPEMWKYFQSLFPADDTMIKQEISAFFRDLIKEVNGIYKNSDFKGRTGYQLRVDRVAINKTCTTNEDNWFCNPDLDVSNFLNLNTYTNHDAYCLAYVFTYRDFADGTLGLAWVAKPGARTGGICSPYGMYRENGSPRGKSLNTGIVTIKNYGERVPKLMSQLTLAHEIGHNYGSEHDPAGTGCTPYTDNNDEAGNYIMYYAAISGKRTNNIKFSSCSRNNIGDVLANAASTTCFKEPTSGHCGNQILDGTEICDCGYDVDCKGVLNCCKCCTGQNEANNANNACSLEPSTFELTVRCDPSQGPCCTSDCGYHLNTVECSPETECSMSSYCNGTTYQCPIPTPLADGSLCDDKTKVCESGECNSSVCSNIGGGWEECSLSMDDGVKAGSLCMISCQQSSTGKCYSSADYDNIPNKFQEMLAKINGTAGINVKPGYPCDKDQGFCDYFLTCRKINELGPLSRLKGLLLSLTSIEELTEWMKQYWWVVLLSVAGLVTLTVLLVKFGAYFTPSSNPDKTPARKITKPLTKPVRRPGPTAGNRRADEMEMRG